MQCIFFLNRKWRERKRERERERERGGERETETETGRQKRREEKRRENREQVQLHLDSFSMEESIVSLHKKDLSICCGEHKLQNSISIQIILETKKRQDHTHSHKGGSSFNSHNGRLYLSRQLPVFTLTGRTCVYKLIYNYRY